MRCRIVSFAGAALSFVLFMSAGACTVTQDGARKPTVVPNPPPPGRWKPGPDDVILYVPKDCYSRRGGYRVYPVDGRSPKDAIRSLVDRLRYPQAAPVSKLLTVERRGRAVLLDFTDLEYLGGVGTSCGSSGFLISVARTVFQFPQIDVVSFTLDGSCDDFWGYLQSTCRNKDTRFPGSITRNEWEN